MLHGFDISAFQGITAPAGNFVFIKVTEGSGYTSSRFAAQWRSAKSRADHRGGYHFARPEASSAKSQAARFLDVLQPVRGESMWLDLEASKLNQRETNAWARAWGDYVRDQAPGITSGVYLGSGYASSNTGRGLADHFDFWWYPQYPSTRPTSTWRTTFDPWLPSGITTGWKRPHIWQFTDNFNGLDASLSWLSLDQLAHGGHQPSPTEEDMAYGGQIPAGKGSQINVSFPHGSMKAAGFVIDNSVAIDGVIAAEPQAQIRYAFHRKAGTWQTGTVKVGSADGGKDHSPKTVVKLTSASDVDYASFLRLDDGTRPVGWDMS